MKTFTILVIVVFDVVMAFSFVGAFLSVYEQDIGLAVILGFVGGIAYAMRSGVEDYVAELDRKKIDQTPQ